MLCLNFEYEALPKQLSPGLDAARVWDDVLVAHDVLW